MSLVDLQTEVFSCSASFLPWAAGLLAKLSVLLLAVGLLAAATGRRHVALAHLVGSFGLAGLLLLPPASLLSLPAPWSGVVVEPVTGTDATTFAGLSADRTVLAWIVGVWMTGAGLLLLRLAADVILLSWHARVHGSGPAPQWSDRARVLARALGIRRPVRLLQSRSLDIPYTWGILRPVVVLPRRAAGWSAERLDAVLTHELGHVRRRDPLFAVLARVACTVFWFHPLAWWVARQSGENAERACDALVVERGMPPVRYARHLLEIVRDARRPAAALAPTMARESMLSRRIVALLEQRRGSSSVRGLTALAVLVIMVLPTFILAAVALPGADAAASSDEASVCFDAVATTETDTDPVSEDPVSVEPAAADTSPIDNF